MASRELFVHPGSTNTSGTIGLYADILDEIDIKVSKAMHVAFVESQAQESVAAGPVAQAAATAASDVASAPAVPTGTLAMKEAKKGKARNPSSQNPPLP